MLPQEVHTPARPTPSAANDCLIGDSQGQPLMAETLMAQRRPGHLRGVPRPINCFCSYSTPLTATRYLPWIGPNLNCIWDHVVLSLLYPAFLTPLPVFPAEHSLTLNSLSYILPLRKCNLRQLVIKIKSNKW